MITTEQIRKLIEEKKVTIGTQATLKTLHAGGLRRVIVASNAAQQTADAVTRHARMAAVELERLSVPNDELGTMCKKPFAISVLGIKK